MLASKGKTELVLNVLLFAEFATWSQQDVQDLILYFEEMVSNGHNQNRVVFSYNAI
jgi:hypothetical protein